MRSGIEQRPRPRRRRWPWLAAIALLIVAGVVGTSHRWRYRTPAGVAEAPPGAPGAVPSGPSSAITAPPHASARPEAPADEAAQEEPLPPLADADDLVREAVRALSARPELVAWLGGAQLVPRFAAAVENTASGESPGPHLSFLAPRDQFRTVDHDGRILIDPASYARYDTVADVVASLDTPGCVALLRRLRPLLDQAYGELGHGAEPFDAALARASGMLLATPVVDGDVFLTERVTTWAFTDPSLERLSPPQKHLLRMGPRNVRLIQAKVQDLVTAAGITPVMPPVRR